MTGGFWCSDSDDRLRTNILAILRQFDLKIDLASPQEALQSFLSENLFLIQALKWAVIEDSKGRRLNFNRLPPKQQTRLISHSAKHLSEEVRLLAPRGVLAVGNAALAACRALATAPTLPRGRVELLRGADHEVMLSTGPTPVNIIFLPVAQNLRVTKRAAAITTDVKHFLQRMTIIVS